MIGSTFVTVVKDGARIDEVADLHADQAGDSIDRRHDRGVIQAELRLFDRGLLRFRLGTGGGGGLHGVVPLLLAGHFALKQLRVALRIHLRLLRGRIGLQKRSFCLGQGRFERTAIDLEKDVAFINQLPFLVILRNEIALHPGFDGGVHRRIELPDVLIVDRHILLLHLGDEHFWRRWRRRRFRSATA